MGPSWRPLRPRHRRSCATRTRSSIWMSWGVSTFFRRLGMTPDEALRAARRQLGNQTAIRARLHDLYGFGWVETLVRDVAYAVRGLGRNPAVSVAAVLTTAIGVGAVASMFSLLHALMLAPPPQVERADRLYRVHTLVPAPRAGEASWPLRASYPWYERLADHADSLESVAASMGMDLAGVPDRLRP